MDVPWARVIRAAGGEKGVTNRSRGRARRFSATLSLVPALLAGLSLAASAAIGQLSPLYQGYSAPADPQDPFAQDNKDDIHIQGSGGQAIVTGYLRLNLDSLPARSSISGLSLTLTPNSSQSDNVNTSMASIQACVLTQPLNSNGYQSSPPPYDCNAVHVLGEPQSNGTWKFEVAPIAQYWTQRQNTGLALLAYPPPNNANLPIAPSAWSVTFAHDKTAATVDFTSPPASTTAGAGQPLPAPAAAPFNPAQGAAAAAPFVGAPVVPPDVAAAPPTETTPGATSTSRAPAPSAPRTAPAPRVNRTWLWLSVAVAAAALLLLAVVAGQHMFREGILSAAAVGRALGLARSQLATPVAVLVLASVLALGFTAQAVGGVPLPGAGGTSVGGLGDPSASPSTGPAAAAGSTLAAGAAAGRPGTSAARPGGTTGAAGAAGRTGPGGAPYDTSQDGPGVTSTTIRLGFVYITSSNAGNDAFGLKAPGSGQDYLAEEKALVAYVNAHGGIGGRQIDPKYVPEDAQQALSDPNIGEEVCRQMTESLHVFAVVGVQGTPNDQNTALCYAQHGTMMFDVTPTVPDLSVLKGLSPYVWPVGTAALDRSMRTEIAGLHQQGFFSGGPTYKLGVVVADDRLEDRVYSEVTAPALKAAGVSNPDKVIVRHDTLSNGAADMKQAVARFQLDSVTNVMFQGGGTLGGGSFAVLFMINAGSQSYHPRYGLSSQDGPAALPNSGQVPQDQFTGALAVGVVPGSDADDQHYKPYPSGASETLCASIEKPAYPAATRADAGVQAVFCDAMFELSQGANGPGPLNAQIWANRAMQLGTGLYSSSTYQGFLGPNHWDSPGVYRLLHAIPNCNGSKACFVFDDSNQYPAN